MSLIKAALLILSFGVVTVQEEGEDVASSPGAVKPPEVQEGPLAHKDARPNFANHNELESYLDGVVEAYMEKDHIAGVTLSVVKDGALVLAKGYGLAGIDPKRPVDAERTMFRVGSISKTFTWTAIMQLVERGALSLDDPINTYLPERLHLPDYDGEPIRVRHLMTHMPGLEDTALGHLFFDEPGEILSLEDYLARYRPAQVRAPGVIPSYSNYGAALAGAIVSHVSGMGFEDYVEAHILAPLGMTHASFREPIPREVVEARGLPEPLEPALAEWISTGFAYEKGGFKPKGFEYITAVAPAGSVSASAADMARYMLAHLGHHQSSGRLLAPETAARMQQDLYSYGEGLPSLVHGFLDYPLPGGFRGIGHAGGTLYFLSNMVLVPDLDLGVFVSTNTTNNASLVLDLPGLIVGRYFAGEDGAPPPEATAEAKARLQRIAGTYLTIRRAHTKIEELLALASMAQVSAEESGDLLVKQGGEVTRYREVAPLVFREVGGPGRIGFLAAEDGAITHMVNSLGVAPMERIGVFGGAQWLVIIMLAVALSGIGTLTGAWLRRNREICQSREELWAARLMPALGACWLLFLVLFVAALAGMAAAGGETLYDFPPGLLVVALWVALLGTLLTALGALSLWPVWTRKAWPLWRRIRHSAAVLIALTFVATLGHWHVIGFHYY